VSTHSVPIKLKETLRWEQRHVKLKEYSFDTGISCDEASAMTMMRAKLREELG
jgi:hypothetical protein